jgi:hypothetical protein
MSKLKKKRKVGKWQPGIGDAINLAAIRWFALSIEAKAIEIYGTNPAVYPNMLIVLGNCLSAVSAISVKGEVAEPDPGDCPPGWVPCGEECAPKCMAESD